MLLLYGIYRSNMTCVSSVAARRWPRTMVSPPPSPLSSTKEFEQEALFEFAHFVVDMRSLIGTKTVGRDCTTLGILEHLLLVDPLLEASLRTLFPYQRLVKEMDKGRKRGGEGRREEVRRKRERRG